jgi:hypothetical protein
MLFLRTFCSVLGSHPSPAVTQYPVLKKIYSKNLVICCVANHPQTWNVKCWFYCARVSLLPFCDAGSCVGNLSLGVTGWLGYTKECFSYGQQWTPSLGTLWDLGWITHDLSRWPELLLTVASRLLELFICGWWLQEWGNLLLFLSPSLECHVAALVLSSICGNNH